MKETNQTTTNSEVIELDFFQYESRILLQKYYYNATQMGNKRSSTFKSIRKAKEICAGKTEFTFEDKTYKGIVLNNTRLVRKIWMETIIIPFYANNVQSFVYFGAIILLLFIAARFVFPNVINERTATIGMGVESIMLFMLAFIQFYTPEDNLYEKKTQSYCNVKDEVNAEMITSLKDSVKSLNESIHGLRVTIVNIPDYVSLPIKDLQEILNKFCTTIKSIESQNIREQVRLELYGLLRDSINNESAQIKENIPHLN
jgi:hypothetical protein